MIDSYRFGEIVVNGKSFRKDVVILETGKAKEWVKEDGMLIKGEAVKEIAKMNPTVVIIGLGYEGSAKLDYSAEYYLGKNNAKVFAEKTKDAVARYNRMQGPGVVAAFHIT